MTLVFEVFNITVRVCIVVGHVIPASLTYYNIHSMSYRYQLVSYSRCERF